MARSAVKSFSSTPNPADVGALGVSYHTSPMSDVTEDKDALTEEALRLFFNTQFTASDDARSPRERIWHPCWDLYNGVYDWSSKAWWQSRINIPEVRAGVDRAVAVFRKSLLRLRQFYQIQAETESGKAKGLFTNSLIGYWYGQANAIEELLTGVKAGLITSMIILKIWWQTTREQSPEVVEVEEPTFKFGVQTGVSTRRDVKFKERKQGKFAIRAVDPFNFWVVPGTNGSAVIERTYATYAEIDSMIKSKVYLESARDKVKELFSGQTTESTQEANRAGETAVSPNRYIRKIELFHYWGDIYSDEGLVAMPNASFTMAGKEILLRKARPNPFYHATPPYVFGSPYKVPFSTYHRGMVEDVMGVASEITELTNLIIDGARFDALKAFAVDLDGLDDPSDLNNGLYPGKTFVKKGSQLPPGAKLIETVDVGHVPQEAMNALNILHRAFQKGTFLNEWVAGDTGSSNRTLGEVNIKTQAALEGLDEAARNIESTVIEPMLTMSAKVIYQFHNDYSLARLVEAFPEAAAHLADLSPAERYATMIGGYEFEVRGLSVMIDQMQMLGSISNILTIISHIPGLMQEIDPLELLSIIMLSVNWNSEKLLLRNKGLPPNPNPLVPGGDPRLSPAQQQNAQQGKELGGATSNPVSAQSPNVTRGLMQLALAGRR